MVTITPLREFNFDFLKFVVAYAGAVLESSTPHL